MRKSHFVAGGGGTRLHIVEAGNPEGRPIVFLHGFSGCWLVWSRQLDSEPAADFRLLALDLRGHGDSDKPEDAYADSQLWADDVHSTISALGLDAPILCGWSYGALVILDYVRAYGLDAIGALNFVGGVTKLGGDEALSVLDPAFLNLVPGFFSTDAGESVRALELLIDLCFLEDLSAEDRFLMLGCMVRVPTYVRQALFSRKLGNDDLLSRLDKPVLITHGADDSVVSPAVIERQMGAIPRSRVDLMRNAGHACFWDDPRAAIPLKASRR
jgi:pimeloyl-ACP methyl ester carboxylesterase